LPSRSEIKRRARRTTAASLIALVVVALTSPLWGGALVRLLAQQITAYSRHFRVQQIVVRGLHAVPESDILRLADINVGTALYNVPAAKSKKRIETHPWVRFAYVRRRMPDTIEIRVTEREPVAALRSSELLMITTDSMVVAPISSGWVWNLPLLTPPRSLNLKAGTALKDSATLALLRETLTVLTVSRDAWRNLSEVYFSGGEIHATLTKPTTDLVLGKRASELAWSAALEIIHTHSKENTTATQTIDLRIPGRIVVTESTTTAEEPVNG
jgi:cell division septal protein FtsQ